MGASAIEFRLRMMINAVIIILGFWAPWIEWWGIGRRVSTVEWLALELSRSGLMSFGVATAAVMALAAVFALACVMFRIWGAAYLGPSTVSNVNMLAGKVVADGPYRFVRNPLYIGLWCMVAAMAFLMPVSGAVVAVVLITVFMIRLTLGEEAFLKKQLGDSYTAYLASVPRYIPRMRRAPAPAGTKPHWLRAVSTELTSIGVLVGVIVYSRNYDLALAGRLLLIFFGASLIMRAFTPSAPKTELVK